MNPLHRPIPDPQAQSCPSPSDLVDVVADSGCLTHSPVVWDELFHAVLNRLECCVDDAWVRSARLPPLERGDATRVVVLECVHAMKQLHASLTCERQNV